MEGHPGPNIKQGNFLTSKQILETGCWSINFSLLNTFQFRFTKDYLLDARFVLTNISIALCAGEWRCWHIDLSLFPSSLKFPNWQSLHQTFQVFIEKFKCGRPDTIIAKICPFDVNYYSFEKGARVYFSKLYQHLPIYQLHWPLVGNAQIQMLINQPTNQGGRQPSFKLGNMTAKAL